MHSIAGISLARVSSRNRSLCDTSHRWRGSKHRDAPSAYQMIVARRTSAEAMPALSAHWDLSKRQASLMAILLQPGTRLRGGQILDFELLNLTAVAPRARCFAANP